MAYGVAYRVARGQASRKIPKSGYNTHPYHHVLVIAMLLVGWKGLKKNLRTASTIISKDEFNAIPVRRMHGVVHGAVRLRVETYPKVRACPG